MVQSMYAGALGIQAHQQAMDVVGNNVANVNTVGFKYSRANFSEMLNQTMVSSSGPSGGMGGTNGLQVGLGSEVTSSTKIFKQGSLQPTDRNTDLALTGDGMFVVSGDGGKTKQYTRAGEFDFDRTGNLVNPAGNVVQGWNQDGDFYVDSTKTVEGVRIDPKLKISASQTKTINAKGNLNSEESIKSLFNLKDGETVSIDGATYTYRDGTPGAGEFHSAQDLATAIGATIVDGKFEVGASFASVSGENADLVNALTPLMSGTLSKKVSPYYALTLDVYDSLGEKSTMAVKFNKLAPTGGANSQAQWGVTVESQAPVDIGDQTAGAGNRTVQGTVTFNTDGSIASLTPTGFAMTANNTSTPNQRIALNFGSKFDGLTSLAGTSNITDLYQDGYASGDLADVTIDGSGMVLGTFSNGEKKTLAQVSVAQFKNNEGLSMSGSNLYNSTKSSGEPTIGVAGLGGRPPIVSSTLEMSNADLSQSLTQLIVIQRGFQASSKTVTTTDTMLDTLMNMKR